MPLPDLHLSPAFARQIEAEGASAYPNECCGILYGRDIRVAQPPSAVSAAESTATPTIRVVEPPGTGK